MTDSRFKRFPGETKCHYCTPKPTTDRERVKYEDMKDDTEQYMEGTEE